MNFIDLQAQYRKYQGEIDEAIHAVLESSQYIMGKDVTQLEAEMCAYTGAKHCISCSSGTDALLLALMACDIKPGDEVITTPFTFIATAEMIAFLGAVPVFVDIDETSYNIDPRLIEQKITPKTRAIIPVALYGQPADMDEINAIASRHNLTVIEDAAQSFGSEYKGKKSCNLSRIGCTSFFPSKPLGCYGDGGAVYTSDDELAGKLRQLMNHGQGERYKHKYIGINGRLDSIQAAILRVKLKYFDEEVPVRAAVASRYNELLAGGEVVTPFVKPDRTSVYAQYSVRVKNRDALAKRLNEQGVPTAVHYPIPLYRQEAFAGLSYDAAEFPVAERVSSEIMSLPMSAFLTVEQQKYIAEAIHGK
ncbi:DegT/DnrJ/EryC1/StrS family aminotransferase [Geomonas sp. Red51]|nr:DegT/DnrJ/EryC1/StrS family aminotransferase [Geomonas azotofigens]